MLQGLNNYLRWVIIILLISLAVLSIYYKYDNCSTCKFEYEEKNIGAREFMELYSERCFTFDSSLILSMNVTTTNK